MGSKAAYRTFQPSMCLISKLNLSCTTMSLKGRFTHENKHYNCSEWLCTFVSSYNSFSRVLWPQHRAKNSRLACRPGIELFDLKEQFACWHMLNIAQMEIINIDNKPVPCVLSSTGTLTSHGGDEEWNACSKREIWLRTCLQGEMCVFTFEQTNKTLSIQQISSFQNDVTLLFPASIDVV